MDDNTSSMLKALQDDDKDQMIRLLARGYKEEEISKEISSEQYKILTCKPPLVSVAVYFGAIKCMVYLLSQGYDLFAPDDVLFLYIKEFIFKLTGYPLILLLLPVTLRYGHT